MRTRGRTSSLEVVPHSSAQRPTSPLKLTQITRDEGSINSHFTESSKLFSRKQAVASGLSGRSHSCSCGVARDVSRCFSPCSSSSGTHLRWLGAVCSFESPDFSELFTSQRIALENFRLGLGILSVPKETFGIVLSSTSRNKRVRPARRNVGVLVTLSQSASIQPKMSPPKFGRIWQYLSDVLN